VHRQSGQLRNLGGCQVVLLPFARWGDVCGDQVVAAAMIDRMVHHADVLILKGSSYGLKDTGIDTLPSARADNTAQ
jgi:hypothetical protein